MSDDHHRKLGQRQRLHDFEDKPHEFGDTQRARSFAKGVLEAAEERRHTQHPYPGENRRDEPRRASAPKESGDMWGAANKAIGEIKQPIWVIGVLALCAVAVPTYQQLFDTPKEVKNREVLIELARVNGTLVKAIHDAASAARDAANASREGNRLVADMDDRLDILIELRKAMNRQGGTHWQHSRALEEMQRDLDELQGVRRPRRLYPDGDSRIGTPPPDLYGGED